MIKNHDISIHLIGFGVNENPTKKEILETLLRDLSDKNGINNYTNDKSVIIKAEQTEE
jgi:hypothetical protein